MYFFDSYAIIELINGNSKYEEFKEDIIITNSLNLSEVFYSLLLRVEEETAKEITNKINFELIDITSQISIESAIFRFKNKNKKMSYADCIGYSCAIQNNLIFLTGDKEFENFPNVRFVKK
jgi:predicted nucleic acid-binding protein